MQNKFNLDSFISQYVTKRDSSLIKEDLINNHDVLSDKIDGKNVLIIGGAGTIGSSYIKAILKFKIHKLVVVDINENGLAELVRDLRSSTIYNIPVEFHTYPVNFGDNVFEKIFKFHGPFHVVSNFAAHKGVRSEKDIFSIEAMIDNNVLRARRLLDLLLRYPPEHFFCVSTDKAANPVNIMGASKKLMEELIMAYSSFLPITTARFANVAFSSGSLPSGFLKRLNKRQPLSSPTGINRFFVSPQESGELCLIASILGQSGDIFFPKLDEARDMIQFDKMAKDLLISLGYTPDICTSEFEACNKASCLTDDSSLYPLHLFESDTSGEKTFEEFYTTNEIIDLTSFLNLGIIKNSIKRSITEIDQIFLQLGCLFENNNITKTEIVDILKNYLPNFNHIETGKNLDQRM